jgi:hypothetical protein
MRILFSGQYFVDAGDLADIRRAFDTIQSSVGDPEVLVYNAGPGGMSFPPPGGPAMLWSGISG